MTSLFDQFEQASLKVRNNNYATVEMNTMGFINMNIEPEKPIFSKIKKDFIPSDKITHVALSNKQLVIVMANNILFRMNMHNPQEQDEISLTKYNSTLRLTNLFLDPTGNHLLLCFCGKTDGNSELLYLNRKQNRFKSTPKFRGYEFTEVAWNNLNQSENSTGSILLGTSKGLIFETEIVLEGEKFFTTGFSSGLEQYWKQVFDIGKGSSTPITGLEYFKVMGADKYVIFATTPSRLYFFTGRANSDDKPLLQQIFTQYLHIPEQNTYIEIMNSHMKYSKLKFWSENLTIPDAFAWMTEKGILYGQIDSSIDQNLEQLKLKSKLIGYPKPIYENYSVSPKFPIAIGLTEFHILIAYTDTVKGVCRLNEEVVYEDNYNEAFGKLINIIQDPITGEIWAISENAIFRFKVTKEERNVWQIFCDNHQFELAKRYSKRNEACYNQVLIKEADMLFNNKEYELSAQRYAETQSSFEEICLKFIQADQQDALKIFLRSKLDTLKPQDKTQITMIVVWVIELYLNKLEEKRLLNLEQSATYADIQKEFETFMALSQVSDCIRKNKYTIQELMASHGDKTNLIKFTILNKDFEQLIRQHIYKNNFHEALDVLKSQNNLQLYYQFAPILLENLPKHTVKALMEQGKKLSPSKLLPALVTCEKDTQSKEVINYLEFVTGVLKNSDKAIHNFLISLYAKHDSKKLLEYFNGQGQEINLVNYDVHFALRLCQEYDLKEACVHLSGLLGMWETAVDLALSIDLKLAKQLADMSPENDVGMRKKLWLKIAQYVISGKNDIRHAMDFLQQCDFIQIEDILPFFSDFVTIDHFKEAICNSLKEYNEHIQNLKAEMEDATQSADQVKNEIQSFRNRYTFINSDTNCEICALTLMTKPFYIFPCYHRFHSDCLLSELNPLLGPAKKNKIANLERQMKVLNNQTNIDSASTASGVSAKDLLKSEIDNIVASECLYCGEVMIRNIDKPFIDDFDYEKIIKEWE